jgi:hypothetical protein
LEESDAGDFQWLETRDADRWREVSASERNRLDVDIPIRNGAMIALEA